MNTEELIRILQTYPLDLRVVERDYVVVQGGDIGQTLPCLRP